LWRVLDFENKVGVSVDTYRIRLISWEHETTAGNPLSG
jgi:hypothetical protein